jgi:hypothetical protein
MLALLNTLQGVEEPCSQRRAPGRNLQNYKGNHADQHATKLRESIPHPGTAPPPLETPLFSKLIFKYVCIYKMSCVNLNGAI